MSSESPGYVTRLLQFVWGIWAWIAFFTCIVIALVAALVIPGPDLRGRILAWLARAPFVLAAVPVTVRGLENLPDQPAVIVGNHMSYVDGFLLKGYLPRRFSFVIKGEFRNVPVASWLLKRAGSHFVERFEAAGSARDARNIVKAAKNGDSLCVFPEGTFREYPGVGRFRKGAFVAAIRAGMPVVPFVLGGCREMMPGVGMPKRVPLWLEILPPIMPDDPQFQSHAELAAEARARIMAVIDEPDLCED